MMVTLDIFDGDRRIIDAQHAGTFARRRTNAAGELRKIIGLVQAVQRLAPEAPINQVIPFRNQIVNRAAAGHAADQLAGVAERNAAIHASGTLLFQVGLGQVVVKFVPIADPFDRRAVSGQFTLKHLKIRLAFPSLVGF
jgi:hypothetical protein